MLRHRSVSFGGGLSPYEPPDWAGSGQQEVIMTRNTNTKSKPRRVAALIAVLALAGALGGCVVYPAGGYYGGGYHHHWDRDGWR
jgi:hypothetical protein